MVKENKDPEYHNTSILDVLAGLLIGSLAGAVTMLLLAPQSGKETRLRIQEKGIELRDRTTEIVEDTMGGRRKAKELLHQGQALVVEQLEHVSEAAQAGKMAIQSS
jgi:gas vesicle protein